jgi:hypothetical protein
MGRHPEPEHLGVVLELGGVEPLLFEALHEAVVPMFALAARTVLETCESVEAGVTFLERVPHARNTNFLLADSAGAISIVEASPEEVITTSPGDGGVVTNHFQSSAMAPLEPDDAGRANSEARLSVLTEWIDDISTSIGLGELQDALADTETGVCACATEETASAVETLWSWTAALGEPEAYLAGGRPDTNGYESIV